MVLVAYEEGRAGIYLMDADGKNLRLLTDSDVGEAVPSWSPDGSQIAFMGMAADGAKGDIYVMSIDSGQLRQITAGSSRASAPAWRPERKK